MVQRSNDAANQSQEPEGLRKLQDEKLTVAEMCATAAAHDARLAFTHSIQKPKYDT